MVYEGDSVLLSFRCQKYDNVFDHEASHFLQKIGMVSCSLFTIICSLVIRSSVHIRTYMHTCIYVCMYVYIYII